MSRFQRFDRVMGRIYHHVGNAVGISIGLFAVAISLDLILRLMGVGNLPGVQEIIEYLFFAGVFLSAPWVLRIGAHVRVDLVISNLPPKVARALDRLLDLLGLSICLVLLWFGTVNLKFAYLFNSLQMKYYHVPEWWLLSVFVVSLSLLVLEFACRLLRGGHAREDDPDALGDHWA